MEFVKFTLSGKTAFFKKPDVNKVVYFTYGNIHKVALLGLLGAIMGYRGYNWQSFVNNPKNKLDFEEQAQPEFYENLKGLNISIVPKNYIFNKKKQTFNNSVGYASKEQGGNLIVNEIWLENPSWDIYIAIDSTRAEEVKKHLLNKDFVYLPYLGKNDHFANIDKVEIVLGEEITETKKIDSLFIRDDFKISKTNMALFSEDFVDDYKYQENLPVALEKEHNMYEFETFIFTNKNVEKVSNKTNFIYNVNNITIATY